MVKGKDKRNFFDINWWQSRSEVSSLFRDSSTIPPALEAAASPTSATKSLAVRIAKAQEASARVKARDDKQVGG